MIKLAIVSPCYNEEEVLENSAKTLIDVLDNLKNKNKITDDSYIVFVNDGSTDSTWDVISKLHEKHKEIKGVSLAFNSGHQSAIMSGMMHVEGDVDAAVTIDADLQDDVNCIEQMVDKHAAGAEVVYGVKTDRKGDGAIKKFTANLFYKLQKAMGVNAINNHADFRLVSQNVLKALSAYTETNLYLRALIPSLKFSYDTVEDTIKERPAGKSKYTSKKMFTLATDGITSFSTRPLKLFVWLGVIFIIVAIINAVDIIVSTINQTAVAGWSQLMLSLWFVGGCILIALGILGVYIGRIFNETKRRPRYVVKETLK